MKRSDYNTETHLLREIWLKSCGREVRKINGGLSVFIRCHYEASAEKVWSALTNHDYIAQWFGKVSESINKNAKLTFHLGIDITSRVLTFEPPRHLVFTWLHPGREEDTVKIQLKSDGTGVTLELEQFSKDKTDWWFGAGAGWESALVRLSMFLQGDNPRNISDDTFDRILGPLWEKVGDSVSKK